MRTRLLVFVALGLMGMGCSGSTTDPTGRTGAANNSSGTAATNAGGGGGTTSGLGDQGGPIVSGDHITDTTGTGGADACPPGQICTNDNPDTDDCGYQDVMSEVETIEKPTNVLFIYDRSTSMTENWGSSTKWQSASNAVVQALTPIQNLILKVGAVFFPGYEVPLICNNEASTCNPNDPLDSNMVAGCCHAPLPTGDGVIGGGCYVSPISAPDQIAFTDPATFLGQVTQKGNPGANLYFTPWEAAAIMSDDAIYDALAAGTLFIPIMKTTTNPMMDAGSVSGDIPVDAAVPMKDGKDELIIIFVTDGEPNCGSNVQNVFGFAQKWFGDGMKTYVLGLPGANGGGGAATNLNQLAASGGTNMYIDAADPAVLQQTLYDIVLENVQGGLASCDITLGQAAAAPDKLRLIVTQQDGTEAAMPKTDANGDDLWVLSADLMTVTLKGNLCDQALAGTYPNFRFDFGCADIPPADPPPPVILK